MSHPLLRLWDGMTLRANFFVKRNHRSVLEERNQLLLGHGHRGVRLDLEDGADKDARILPPEVPLVTPDHVQEGRNESRIWVKFNVGGEDEVGVGGFAGDVPPHVDRVIERAGSDHKSFIERDRSLFTHKDKKHHDHVNSTG